jgi:hypothetical protein
LIFVIVLLPSAGRCTPAAYAGIYIIIDPYGQTDIQNLQTAASALANGCGTTGLSTPFCKSSSGTGYVSGIYLRVRWCSWELANVTLGTNSKYELPGQSCYYVVDPTHRGTPISALPNDPENVSPCATLAIMPQYDTCTTIQNGANSQLLTTLGYIDTINQARIAAKMSPLQITVGLEAGASSAMKYIYNASSQPTTFDLGSTIGANYCVRTPNDWDPNYISAFYTALDNLITKIQTYSSSFTSSITSVKVAPVNLITGEFDLGANEYAVTTATDSGRYTPANASPITCPTGSTGSGAYRLLTSYNSQHMAYVNQYGNVLNYPDCRYYTTISQGTECLLGLTVGSVRATLKVDQRYSAIETVDENNSNALGDIDCGTSSTGDPGASAPCVVQGTSPSTSGDEWSLYYLFYDVGDLLVSNSVAQSAAAWAFSKVSGAGKINLLVSQIALEWTGLTPPPSGVGYNYFTDPMAAYPSTTQVACALNNVAGTPQFSYILDGTPFDVSGLGTVLAWQEDTGAEGTYCDTANPQGSYANETEYEALLYSGYSNGSTGISGTGGSAGQTIEVYPDVAFNSSGTFTGYFTNCAPDLTAALAYLQATSSPPGTCAY